MMHRASSIRVFLLDSFIGTGHNALQVFDYRNDVILAETCREDVNKFCEKVLKGG
jgi:hypothetical protein